MNGAHLHLILNHIPIIGGIFAFLLLAFGTFFKNPTVSLTGLITLICVAAITIPVYLSGEEAEHAVEHMTGVNQSAIEEHEEQAEMAFWTILMSGAIALGTILASRATLKPSSVLLYINLAFLLVVIILMVRAGYSGGTIHHPEIKSEQQVFDFDELTLRD